PGDKILMVGGRVGKDGIHGATASSMHADESTPATIVQIGSPITQKLLSDFLEIITRQGLVKSCTDNGAGGLSSSVGELAELSGGAVVHLEKVPLKYGGLLPWEIFVSESQERMTLVCDQEFCATILHIAKEFEVEASIIGEFTASGLLEVYFEDRLEACLPLQFLHHGVPKKKLFAEWKKPLLDEPHMADCDSYNEILSELLARDNICSRKAIIRQYDHEVKGRTILKPLMGKNQNAPQDAAVMRLYFDNYQGIAIANGIIPRYGDIDPYQMSAGSFDEAIRQIIAVGGKLPDPHEEHPRFWSVNDNFCMPNIIYDPESNPDGKLKLAKLVLMCDALYDMSTYFHIPMTSGKDSMKNDFGTGGDKISVPPTILYSIVSAIPDVRVTLSSEWKNDGDLIYQVGKTYDELGASEFYAAHGFLGANVPVVRKKDAKRIYEKFAKAHERSLMKSAHDLSDGGLLVALAECSIGSGKGAFITITTKELSHHALFFAESHSRFIVSVAREHQQAFEAIMSTDAILLGEVTKKPELYCTRAGQTLVQCSVEQMSNAWERNLT
ncbi:MAG TPA: AIR synthase-related protein, partial [Myxococcota bacterium]|nr:AIR synthase-related protein [Myxococcota bacterium]